MIAVVKEKHRGLKTLHPEEAGTKASKRVLGRLSDEDGRVLQRVLVDPAQFVDNPAFHARKSAREIEKCLDNGGEEFLEAQARLIPIELFEESDRTVKRFKTLTQEQESRLFLRLNYCRYIIYRLLWRHRKQAITVRVAREVMKWKRRELKVRSQLTQANIPLVLAMAKRTKPVGVDFSELISEGNMALLRSVDKFDCGRGFKFSTYACRAILKSFSRVALKTTRYRTRFPVEFDPDLEKGDVIDVKRESAEAHCVDSVRDILGSEGEDLTNIERKVLRARFAIGDDFGGEGPMTLEQVGRIIGVTKERVRQIQNKALTKLREVLEDQVLAG